MAMHGSNQDESAGPAAKLLVLDFDGTMTDAEVEGAPYRQGVLEDVALLIGRTYAEVDADASAVEAEIAADPQRHGWMFGGRIVAPATVDPYLRVMQVARRLLDRAGRYLDERDRAGLFEGLLYKYNYRKTQIAFQPGAGAFLHAMAGRPVHIVTNSHRDAVQDKIRTLGGGFAGDFAPPSSSQLLVRRHLPMKPQNDASSFAAAGLTAGERCPHPPMRREALSSVLSPRLRRLTGEKVI